MSARFERRGWVCAGLALSAALLFSCNANAVGASDTETQATDWVVEKEATGTTYALTGDNSRLSIECVAERFGGGAVISMVVDGLDPAPRSKTNVIIGERIFDVRHDFVGVGVTDCPECGAEFEALWSALAEPQTDEITLKSGDKRRYLGSHGGETALGPCVPDFRRNNLE